MTGPAAPIVPSFLEPGEPIAVLAPSGVVDPERLQAGIAYLERKGHPVVRGEHLLARHGYLAGDDDTRADGLNAFIAAAEPRALLFARGGYGLTRILGRLDLAGLRRRPRLLIGYSDVTALFMALQRRGPCLTLYGPMAAELGDPAAFDEGSLWEALYGGERSRALRFSTEDVLRPGTGSGVVIGGCLTVLVSLLGTPHDLDYRDAILFWEEIREEPYRIDRMLTQLRNAGKLDRLKGMIVGSLTGCEPPPGRPSLTVRQILEELARDARFPIVMNVRAGHLPGKITLPLGAAASLSTGRGELRYRIPAAVRAGARAGRRSRGRR